MPEIQKVARIEVQNLSNVPSDYMDPDRWMELQKAVAESLARPEVAGVIVSHGTDTLEETAWFPGLADHRERAGDPEAVRPLSYRESSNTPTSPASGSKSRPTRRKPAAAATRSEARWPTGIVARMRFTPGWENPCSQRAPTASRA